MRDGTEGVRGAGSVCFGFKRRISQRQLLLRKTLHGEFYLSGVMNIVWNRR